MSVAVVRVSLGQAPGPEQVVAPREVGSSLEPEVELGAGLAVAPAVVVVDSAEAVVAALLPAALSERQVAAVLEHPVALPATAAAVAAVGPYGALESW